jgi:hypothetical protein
MRGALSRDGDPDVISYNGVVHAWARSGSPQAGERAEQVLRNMTTVPPNARTYSTVMDAWSRSFATCPDSAARAHALLTEMEQRSASDSTMKPDYVSYSTVVNAYALSKTEPLKAHKAFSILQRMHRLARNGDANVRPNRVTYNSVLNACATSCPLAVQDHLHKHDLDSKLPTLPDMVRKLYRQLLVKDDQLRPDHFTFGTVLKAVANLFWGEPDQVEFGKTVFEEACARGQVSFGVLWQLRQAMPVDIYRELLPPNALCGEPEKTLMNHIPKEWKYNVREETRRYKPNNNRNR